VASHTHEPFALLHSSPDAHAVQATPAAPHEPVDSDAYGSHVPLGPPMQQPFAHEWASQLHVPVVVSQTPFAQLEHAAPAVPHCPPFCEAYGTQRLPLQQPPGHDAASQMQ